METANLNGIWNARSGEWEDFHEPLPEVDHTWALVRVALLVCSSAVSISALAWWWL